MLLRPGLHSPLKAHHYCKHPDLGQTSVPQRHSCTASASASAHSSRHVQGCTIMKHERGLQRLVCSADADRAPDSFNPNLFRGKGDPKKQDAARKALEDMFKGKSDTLAAFDPQDRGGSGSSGGKGDGSGGGGWGFGGKGGGSGGKMPDWRQLLASLSGFFRRRFGELGKALQAILAFAAVMLAFCYLGDVIGVIQGWLTVIFRWVLRLDARQGQLHKPHALQPSAAGDASGLGAFESSVIAKYGPSSSETAEAL